MGLDQITGGIRGPQRGGDEFPAARARTRGTQDRCAAGAHSGSTQARMAVMRRRRTVFVDSDMLVVVGGMSGGGAIYECSDRDRDLKIVSVEKAKIERSGAGAQGLYAINC